MIEFWLSVCAIWLAVIGSATLWRVAQAGHYANKQQKTLDAMLVSMNETEGLTRELLYLENAKWQNRR